MRATLAAAALLAAPAGAQVPEEIPGEPGLMEFGGAGWRAAPVAVPFRIVLPEGAAVVLLAPDALGDVSRLELVEGERATERLYVARFEVDPMRLAETEAVFEGLAGSALLRSVAAQDPGLQWIPAARLARAGRNVGMVGIYTDGEGDLTAIRLVGLGPAPEGGGILVAGMINMTAKGIGLGDAFGGLPAAITWRAIDTIEPLED